MSENLPEITPEVARDFARALMPELARRLQLIEFLTSRYDEREAAAQAVRGRAFESWNRSWDDGSTRDLVIDGERVTALPIDMDDHIALNDPAYVLADIAAKRSILSNARYALEIAQDEAPRDPSVTDAHSLGYRLGQWHGYHTALRLLAQVFAEHPDFDPEWSA